MQTLVGWIELKHITDGVLHGDVHLHSGVDWAKYQNNCWAIAEFADNDRLSAVRLCQDENGMFGMVQSPEDIPLAYPLQRAHHEFKLEDLQAALAKGKVDWAQGIGIPCYEEV